MGKQCGKPLNTVYQREHCAKHQNYTHVFTHSAHTIDVELEVVKQSVEAISEQGRLVIPIINTHVVVIDLKDPVLLIKTTW